jgi:hypothetical protein
MAAKMQASDESFLPRTVGNALYGLQNMSSAVPEVRQLLAAIIDKAKGSNGTMTSQGIGNALYGLQSMDTRSPEVCELLLLLRGMMRRASQTDCVSLNPQEVGNALFGLRNMSYLTPGVPELLSALHKEAENCVRLFQRMPIIDRERWTRVLVHSIVLTIPQLPDIEPAAASRFEAVLPALADLLGDAESTGLGVCSSTSERRVFNTLQTHFKDRVDVSIATNQYLHHFEADIVVTFLLKEEGSRCEVNVEVDGAPSHSLLTATRFQSLRDSYLTSEGVLVLRLRGAPLLELSQATVDSVLRQQLQNAQIPAVMGGESNRARAIEGLLGPSPFE